MCVFGCVFLVVVVGWVVVCVLVCCGCVGLNFLWWCFVLVMMICLCCNGCFWCVWMVCDLLL